MKLREKLSFQFTLLFGVLLLVILIGIYFFVEQNRKESFYAKLKDRAMTVAQLYLAKDNLSTEKFKDVEKKYPLSLPSEINRIYTLEYKPVFIKEDSISWSKQVIDEVIKSKMVFFNEGNKQIAGLYYIDNSGDFIIITSAIDQNGYQNMEKLKWIMTLFFLVSLFITFFLGRMFSRVALAPISKIINNVKVIRSTSLYHRLPINKYRNDEINDLSKTINELLEHLERSFEAQRSFVANASHELRTPITSIMGNAEIALHHDRDTEEYKNTLKNIIQESDHLNDLINNLLDLVQAETSITDGQEIRLDELLWEITDEWKNKLKNTSIEVVYKLPDNPARFTLIGNRHLLFIGISNILKNAIKFSNEQPVQCTLYCNHNHAIITIKDNGIGIAPDDVHKIFQPFYRAPNALGYPGFGVGLSMAQKITHLHHGTIHIDSKLDKGTLFTLSFPI